MVLLLQQLLSGLTTGAVYSLMALALVVIHQTTHHLNLAQGEMATMSTFAAWQLLSWGFPYWAAFAVTLAVSFIAGAAIQRVIMHPLRAGSGFIQFAAMIGLFLVINSITNAVWGSIGRSFPSPFPARPLYEGAPISGQRLGIILIGLALVVFLTFLLRGTRLGLSLRATAANPVSARLAGIAVGRMMMVGWGLAAAIGAAAGMLLAPIVALDPQMMFNVLPFAFAAVVLGGVSSPLGAVVGGLVLGVVETLVTTFAPLIGRELKMSIVLAAILGILLVKPEGLFVRRTRARL
ncbi:MAG: branched-chain amino acid ABC transporter permease [Bauldia sp.]|nr:branched-chain amino acid ABC transporter permease [Bauldia sp.]